MGKFTQNGRPIKIQSPLGTDQLLVDRFDGEEGISALFEFRVRLRSYDLAIDPAKLIGQPVTFSIDRTDRGATGQRYFNGLVIRFENHGLIDREMCMYSAVVRPWLWLLTQTSDCRIFQNMGAMDIVKKLLAESGSFPFEPRVSSPPPPRDYCVQYNETDFAFISRLLEEEGIYYYFRHENGKHTLVIGDDASALGDSAEAKMSFLQSQNAPGGKDRIRKWTHQYELRPGKWSHTDYNFETPDVSLLGSSTAGKLPGMPKNELFEWPGKHGTPDLGTKRASFRADQTVYEYDSVRGQSISESFSPGLRFTVDEHHTASEKGRKYVLTYVKHEGNQPGAYGESALPDQEPPPVYTNAFVAVAADSKIRPTRATPRPRIMGPQTALVVGPQGEEIWTDTYGRIKVQFYWDRYGQKDEKSSCWVRVAFASAGSSWGLVAIPRIGYEVVVEFLDGDPDRPLVTGCVYNARNMPPLSSAGKGSAASDMPGAKMMSTLRSQSLKKTGGYNEITMNDTSGDESLFIKAQHDEVHKVGHNRDDSVANNRTTSIGNDDTLTVGHDRKDTIQHDRKVSITNDDTLEVGNDLKITVSNDRTTSVGNNDKLTVSSDRTVNVNGNQSESIQQNASQSAQQITLTGQMKITLKCGGSTIELTPAMITIQAPLVKIN